LLRYRGFLRPSYPLSNLLQHLQQITYLQYRVYFLSPLLIALFIFLVAILVS
jgi:hypothetical protein